MAAAVLAVEGFTEIDPQTPPGGPDDNKDIAARREGYRWVAAVFFPPTRQPFSAVRAKFHADLAGVAKLAESVGVGNDHLSRVLSGARGQKPTGDLARRIAEALGLPPDYFPEARLQYVIDHLEDHPVVRDEVYDQLQRATTRG